MFPSETIQQIFWYKHLYFIKKKKKNTFHNIQKQEGKGHPLPSRKSAGTMFLMSWK